MYSTPMYCRILTIKSDMSKNHQKGTKGGKITKKIYMMQTNRFYMNQNSKEVNRRQMDSQNHLKTTKKIKGRIE